MSKPMHETQQLSFAGAVDADGHILEPPDMWENYIDPKYQRHALRFAVFAVDDEHHVLHRFEIAGDADSKELFVCQNILSGFRSIVLDNQTVMDTKIDVDHGCERD